MQNLTAPDLAAWLADESRPSPVLLDVREPWEVQTAHIAGSVSIPMRDIPARSEELDDDATIVCVCHHGARSASVAMFLETQRGFKNMINLQGGIDAWSRQVDPSVPTY
ncbi:rhodanese-like domain-containing protein [Paraburkholderia sp.]|uniref:rhodanese-like domain-containing protein n=1 Tax=Paraburkholderia sp. TaxID=1926495 RepID=UPI00238AC8A9|nr:rhodanese-like domain-containing protein [Paraburkholderia sp.]MDE1182952.1 rhodanese-like domain-containing protein [Paraburkholderia sp.]